MEMNQDQSAGSGQASELGESTEKKDTAFMALKGEKKKLAEENAALKSKLQEIEDAKLKQQNEWKTLFEQRDDQLKKEVESRQNLERVVLNAHKKHAFEKEIGGALANDAYYSHVDFDSIVFNPETKSLDHESLKMVSKKFMAEHPLLVARNTGKMPNVGTPDSINLNKSIEAMTSQELEKHIRTLAAEGKI